jgi:hypothetical protein
MLFGNVIVFLTIFISNFFSVNFSNFSLIKKPSLLLEAYPMNLVFVIWPQGENNSLSLSSSATI